MCFFITDIRQQFIAVLDNRRTFIRPHRGDGLYHIRNSIRIGYDDFLRLIAAKIGKLFQHLFCRPKIEGRLIIRIRKMLPGHDDSPVNLVPRVQKMYVTGSNHRLMKLFAELYDFAVDFLNIFHRVNIGKFFGCNHILVIAKRLNLQIIIKTHEPCDFRIRFTVEKRTVQFPRLTGASENQPFPVLL